MKKVGMSHHCSNGATVLLHARALELLLDSQSDPVSLTANSKKNTKISLEMTVVNWVRLATVKPCMALLGSKASSVFAHNFLMLFSDSQYFSDCAAIFGCEL
jgi:hypothetical protein